MGNFFFRRTTSWGRVVAALVALAAIFGGSHTAAAGSEGTQTLAGPDVVHYGLDPYVLEDSHRLVRQGERLADGGCAFSAERAIEPGGSVAEIEIAFDPSSCQSLVEIGTLVEPAADLVGDEDQASLGERVSVTPKQTLGTLSTASTIGRFQAFQWSWFDEPARWVRNCDVEDPCPPLPPVNTVRNGIDWQPDGTCAVAPGTIGFMDFEITWLRATGWNLIQNDWTHSPDPIPCDQDIFSQNVNFFRNNEFCAAVLGPPFFFLPTDVHYDINKVRGDENGTAFFRWEWRKSGPCSVLLRFNQKHDNMRIG